jgi:hypothetical protein
MNRIIRTLLGVLLVAAASVPSATAKLKGFPQYKPVQLRVSPAPTARPTDSLRFRFRTPFTLHGKEKFQIYVRVGGCEPPPTGYAEAAVKWVHGARQKGSMVDMKISPREGYHDKKKPRPSRWCRGPIEYHIMWYSPTLGGSVLTLAPPIVHWSVA